MLLLAKIQHKKKKCFATAAIAPLNRLENGTINDAMV
jgi:hypothetical protein